MLPVTHNILDIYKSEFRNKLITFDNILDMKTVFCTVYIKQ